MRECCFRLDELSLGDIAQGCHVSPQVAGSLGMRLAALLAQDRFGIIGPAAASRLWGVERVRLSRSKSRQNSMSVLQRVLRRELRLQRSV